MSPDLGFYIVQEYQFIHVIGLLFVHISRLFLHNPHVTFQSHLVRCQRMNNARQTTNIPIVGFIDFCFDCVGIVRRLHVSHVDECMSNNV